MKIVRSSGSVPVPRTAARLLQDVREMILAARERVVSAVNAGQVLLYWHVGDRIGREVLQETRATYGEEIVSTLSKQLATEFGRGFSKPNLSRMMRLVTVFPDRKIVAALSQQLGWSHFVEIIPLKDPLQREFYAEMCRDRALERATVAGEDWLDAVRADGAVKEAGQAG